MNAWRFKLLFDGECPFCQREARFLQRRNRHGYLAFEDITAPGFDPAVYHTTREELMGVIHGVFPDGRLVKKVEVFREAYRAIGLGWLLAPTGWPGSRQQSAACRRESAGSRVESMASRQESAGSLTNFNEWMRIYWVFAIKWKFPIRPKPLTWLISMKLTKILKLDRCTFTVAERDMTIAHRRQPHGGSGRHGGHGRFSRHRFAGVRAQGAGARPPRGKSRRCPARRMTRAIFKSAWSLQTATMQPGKWQDEHRPLVDERGNVIGIVSAKGAGARPPCASAALAATGSLPENVNFAGRAACS